jgi:hypothetical protein
VRSAVGGLDHWVHIRVLGILRASDCSLPRCTVSDIMEYRTLKFPWTSLLKCPVAANTGAGFEEIQFPLVLIIGNTLLAPAGD